MLMFTDFCHTAAPSASTYPPTCTSAESDPLQCVQLTFAAERHLVSQGKPCPDHQMCRQLAFARFLYMTGRISDDARS